MGEMIREYCDSRGETLKVDREHGVIGGVKILGLSSKNNRTYTKEAVARAAALYEGSKVNIDHPEGNPNASRSYAARIGSVRNVTVDSDGGLRGDLHFNPKHALAEQLIWDAEHSPENVGFSHNIEGRTSRGKAGVVVEEISRVQSVDLVADPATTRGLFENFNQEGEDTLEIKDITEAMLSEQRPDLIDSIKANTLEAYLTGEEAKAKDAKLVSLTEEVETLKASALHAAKTAAIASELSEAKLPQAVVDLIKPQLLEAKDADARKAILAKAKSVSTVGNPKSREQNVTEGATGNTVTDAKSFARSITE